MKLLSFLLHLEDAESLPFQTSAERAGRSNQLLFRNHVRPVIALEPVVVTLFQPSVSIIGVDPVVEKIHCIRIAFAQTKCFTRGRESGFKGHVECIGITPGLGRGCWLGSHGCMRLAVKHFLC